MEGHTIERLRLLKEAKETLIKNLYDNSGCIEEVLMQIELLSDNNVVLKTNYRTILRNKVQSTPEMLQIDALKNNIEVTQVAKQGLCPITQKVINVPFEAKCGHLVEESAAEAYIKSRRASSCPVRGCKMKFERK